MVTLMRTPAWDYLSRPCLPISPDGTLRDRQGKNRLLPSVVLAIATLTGLALAQAKPAPKASTAISIGGEPVAVLQRPAVSDRGKPQFVGATFLPGRGMSVLQIKAYLPGKGEIDVLNAPPLPDAQKLLDQDDDEFGTQIFKMGGALLLPFANRIRGKVSADGKTITATIDGKTVTLPANWSGNKPGAEKHAIHGLMRRSQFQDVIDPQRPQGLDHLRRVARRQLWWTLAVGYRRGGRDHA